MDGGDGWIEVTSLVHVSAAWWIDEIHHVRRRSGLDVSLLIIHHVRDRIPWKIRVNSGVV